MAARPSRDAPADPAVTVATSRDCTLCTCVRDTCVGPVVSLGNNRGGNQQCRTQCHSNADAMAFTWYGPAGSDLRLQPTCQPARRELGRRETRPEKIRTQCRPQIWWHLETRSSPFVLGIGGLNAPSAASTCDTYLSASGEYYGNRKPQAAERDSCTKTKCRCQTACPISGDRCRARCRPIRAGGTAEDTCGQSPEKDLASSCRR